MKEWPKDKEETVYYGDLIKPIRKALEEAYTLTRNENVPSITYTGYNAGINFLACNPPPDEQLQPDMIEYHADRGRDVLDIILNITFALGMEQGRRLEAPQLKTLQLINDIYIKMLKRKSEPKKVTKKKKNRS